MVSIYTTYAIGSPNSSVNTLIEPWAVLTELIWWSPTRSRLHRIRLSEPPNRNRIGQWELSKARDPHSLPNCLYSH